jgi:hypothetical protein
MQKNEKIRPALHLESVAKYAKVWPLVDKIREARGKEFPDWPEWCYLPYVFYHSFVKYHHQIPESGYMPPHIAAQAGVLSVLGIWRITQGIYRFDPDIYKEILSTPFDGNLPTDIFYYLPEWCIYIETPEMVTPFGIQYGVYVHLDYDMNREKAQLCFSLDRAIVKCCV